MLSPASQQPSAAQGLEKAAIFTHSFWTDHLCNIELGTYHDAGAPSDALVVHANGQQGMPSQQECWMNYQV